MEIHIPKKKKIIKQLTEAALEAEVESNIANIIPQEI